MRTLKLWAGAVALGIVTLWVEPASAGVVNAASADTVTATVANASSTSRSQVVLAAMVAGLSAMLLLRRHVHDNS